MTNQSKLSISEVLAGAFTKVYPPDSFDPVNIEYNGQPLKKNADLGTHAWKYNFHPITMMTSFLGLPNRCPDYCKQSWSNIGKNLIGWQDNKTLARTLFNVFKILYVLPLNLLTAVVKTALNLVKLATELLPRIAADLCSHGRRFADARMSETQSKLAWLGYAALYGAAIVGQTLFESIYFIGQAVTSPIKGVRSAWKLGQRIAGKGLLGKILGGALVSLSIGITVTVYALTLPLAAKAIGPIILSKMPAAVSQAVSTLVEAIAPVTSAIGNFMMPVLGKAFTAIGMSISPAAVGMAAVKGMLLATIGTMISRAADRFINWWDNSAEKPAKSEGPTRQGFTFGGIGQKLGGRKPEKSYHSSEESDNEEVDEPYGCSPSTLSKERPVNRGYAPATSGTENPLQYGQ